MVIENFTPIPSLIGGVLIGLSASIMLLLNGKIAGISGITKGMISKDTSSEDRKWRIYFFLGLVLGGFAITLFMPEMTAKALEFKPLQIIIAGLLVGVGTSFGNGCTSGHGVCGLGRRSPRSLASVITFMTVGFITVFLMFHVFNLGG